MRFKQFIREFDKSLDYLSSTQYKFDELIEAIIYPEKIRVADTDIKYLNNKFKKSNIIFKEGKELLGMYDPKTNNITVEVTKNTTKNELEAILGHEIIHREQNKKSNNLYGEKTETLVQEINDKIERYKLTGSTKLLKEIQEKQNFFLYGTAQEKMAYAYQLVKDKTYNFQTPEDVITFLKNIPYVKVDNQFKKYIGMYFLIKDKL